MAWSISGARSPPASRAAVQWIGLAPCPAFAPSATNCIAAPPSKNRRRSAFPRNPSRPPHHSPPSRTQRLRRWEKSPAAPLPSRYPPRDVQQQRRPPQVRMPRRRGRSSTQTLPQASGRIGQRHHRLTPAAHPRTPMPFLCCRRSPIRQHRSCQPQIRRPKPCRRRLPRKWSDCVRPMHAFVAFARRFAVRRCSLQLPPTSRGTK